MTKRKYLPVVYVLVAVVIFFSLNIIGRTLFSGIKADLTEDNLYTISEGTKSIASNIDEPITMRVFFSNRLANGFPNLKSYAIRVRGLLEQYVDHSDGKIRLEVIDPEPFSEQEDLAVSLGLKGAPMDNSGQKLYFGLSVANAADQIEAIPFFALDREKFLEYDISRIIYDLDHPKKITVGLLSQIMMELDIPGRVSTPGPGAEGAGGAWAVIQQLRELYNVEVLDKELNRIPEHIDFLMVVHPANLKDETVYAIDQFVLGGGKAIFFADPNAEDGTIDNEVGRNSSFDRLFNQWGFNVSSQNVVADRVAARRMPARGEGDINSMIGRVTSLALSEENFNQNEIISSQLQSIIMSTAGFISEKSTSGADIKIIPLFTSSKESMRIKVDDIKYYQDSKRLLRGFTSENEEFTLAARISGKVKSAFNNDTAKKNKSSHLSESKDEINIIVVADTDILHDRSWVDMQRFLGYTVFRAFADNSAFLINAIDNFAGSADLIDIRTRGAGKRDFTVVEEIKRAAEERYLAKEEELQQRLRETEERLAQLQRSVGDNKLAYNQAGMSEINRFQDQVVRIRKELRAVRRELDKDIDSLGSRLKFINIGAIPIIVVAFALFFLVGGKRISLRKKD